MKFILISIGVTLLISSCSNKNNDNYTDNKSETYSAEPKAIDLGLSILWADRNIGATLPNETGDYFAWGEVEPKDIYSWETYKYFNDKDNNGRFDGESEVKDIYIKDNLLYDAAHVNWGDDWIMPSSDYFDELIDECKWEWNNNEKHYKVVGPNGNYIIIPEVVKKDHYTYTYSGINYWSSYSHHRTLADELTMGNSQIRTFPAYRYIGMPIRPVKPKPKTDGKTEYGIQPIDLGLSVLWADRNIRAQTPNDYGKRYSIYDAISKNEILNDGWRLPTKKELEELCKNCSWTWDTSKKNPGSLITGTTGNSIFLPASGFHIVQVYERGVVGHYWSSTLNENDYMTKVSVLCCSQDSLYVYDGFVSDLGNKSFYRSIRFVKDK